VIGETEARARAEYMAMVRRQLEILRDRRDLAECHLPAMIRGSSLRLAEIEWVREMVDEASRQGRSREVLDRLVMYYEGYFEALARVLEVKPDELVRTFDPAKIRALEAEMLKTPGAS